MSAERYLGCPVAVKVALTAYSKGLPVSEVLHCGIELCPYGGCETEKKVKPEYIQGENPEDYYIRTEPIQETQTRKFVRRVLISVALTQKQNQRLNLP